MKNTNLLLALLLAAFFVSCSEDSKQQFTLLSSSETGIDFVNQLYEDNDINYFKDK